MKKYKWGIIGTGKIAGRFANDLKLLASAELTGVFSRNSENSKKFAAEFNTKPFYSIEELLTSDVDIIYIATPHANHLEHSLASIRAGKAVICEKPMAMNVSECEEILNLAKIKNVFVMEAMWTRFFPAIQEVFELVNSGALGKIIRIEASFGYQSTFDASSRIFNPELGGGSLLDVGIYPVAFAQMILNESPVVISSTAKMASTGVDESAQFQLTYPSGAILDGKSSVVEPYENSARIIGTIGEIQVPKFWCPREFVINGVQRVFELQGMGLHYEASEVMNCLSLGVIESPRMPHGFSVSVMRTLDLINNRFNLR